MRAFKVINLKKENKLKSQFSQFLVPYLEYEEGFNHFSRICVFDHFLDSEEAIKLIDNISKEERINRDIKWSALYKAISNKFDIYMLKYRSGKLIFKEPRSSELLCRRLGRMDIDGHVWFVIPELDLCYQQNWDDTHLVYYQDPSKLEGFLNIVYDSGLYWLN
ncbi:hypothetical protein V6260_02830 [Pseudoalteromonas aliena]|uniref:hypothetical protein n=1 Tax=Pseudoalteromonas aliena TaxID=247523 RepID=UPI00311F94B2